MGRPLGAVGGTEGIHHEHVAQCGVLLRQLVSVLLLALVEAHVLEQHQVARLDLDAVEVVGQQRHFAAQGLGQVLGHRLQAVLGGELALGRTAQVRADHHRRALLQGQLEGRQGGLDPCIALHLAVLHGHVEVLADQHALTFEVEVSHLQHGHDNQSLGTC
ncbi:Uncharacterised protein [Acinetobacter baumannii]|nr:Uncharacterised protein [Acinetobacter baumannii]